MFAFLMSLSHYIVAVPYFENSVSFSDLQILPDVSLHQRCLISSSAKMEINFFFFFILRGAVKRNNHCATLLGRRHSVMTRHPTYQDYTRSNYIIVHRIVWSLKMQQFSQISCSFPISTRPFRRAFQAKREGNSISSEVKTRY